MATHPSSIIVKVGRNRRAVNLDDILYFESKDHQTYVVTETSELIYEQPIRDLERQLPLARFVRISRQAMVNLSHVEQVSGVGGMRVRMKNAQVFTVSRSRRKDFVERYETYQSQSSFAQRYTRLDRQRRSRNRGTLYGGPNEKLLPFLDDSCELAQDQQEKLRYLANQPYTYWLGEWSNINSLSLRNQLIDAERQGQIPVFVVYRLFLRDETYGRSLSLDYCEDYLNWIRHLAYHIQSRPAIIVLEPNALAGAGQYYTSEQLNILVLLLQNALNILKQCPNLKVYLDAGHPFWLDESYMAVLLARSGIDLADGFALNVAHYIENDAVIGYGERLSRLLGDKPFVIDTGRNGRGIRNPEDWCNPPDVGTGRLPSLQTRHDLIDAYLWIKPPGESDGALRPGMPKDGVFWLDKALSLVDLGVH
jgi:endoglucanase